MKESATDAIGVPGSVGRRRLLGAGVALSTLAVCTAAGCTPSDPRVDSPGFRASPRPTPSASASPQPTPSATPSVSTPPAALTAELALAGLAAAILKGPHHTALNADQRRTVTAIGEAHRQHAVALSSPEPTTRPISGSPALPTVTISKLALAASISLLSQHERAQAARLRKLALADDGFLALLWGSMSVASTVYASAVVSTAAVPVDVTAKTHLPMTAVSDVEAIQSMVRQLHAVVYGYQLALGNLKESSSAGQRALQTLAASRKLRDALIDDLVARSAAVPAAAGAYVPTVNPTTAARSARLIRHLQVAMQPFCGLWLASTTKPQDRKRALDTLLSTTTTARSWNAPLTVWPGWQD